jgi:hypothetical protein
MNKESQQEQGKIARQIEPDAKKQDRQRIQERQNAAEDSQYELSRNEACGRRKAWVCKSNKRLTLI